MVSVLSLKDKSKFEILFCHSSECYQLNVFDMNDFHISNRFLESVEQKLREFRLTVIQKSTSHMKGTKFLFQLNISHAFVVSSYSC